MSKPYVFIGKTLRSKDPLPKVGRTLAKNMPAQFPTLLDGFRLAKTGSKQGNKTASGLDDPERMVNIEQRYIKH